MQYIIDIPQSYYEQIQEHPQQIWIGRDIIKPLQTELEEIKTEIENVDLFNTYFFEKHFKSPLDIKNDILIILDNHIFEPKGENNE